MEVLNKFSVSARPRRVGALLLISLYAFFVPFRVSASDADSLAARVSSSAKAESMNTASASQPPQAQSDGTFASLNQAIEDAKLKKLGVDPDSPNEIAIKRWGERIRNDSDIKRFFGGMSGSGGVSLQDAAKFGGSAESLRRLTPDDRSVLLQFALRALENAPQDCGGVKSESEITSRFMPLSTMSTAEIDAYLGAGFAMLKQTALRAPLADVTPEQREQAQRSFLNTLKAQLKDAPETTRDLASTIVDPTKVAPDVWCRAKRAYYRAILATPQPERDWLVVSGAIEYGRAKASAVTKAEPEPSINVSAQSYSLKVQRRVAPNIVWTGPTKGLETAVRVRCAPSGTLLSAVIVRSSGDPEWDQAALAAVERSDPMPLDEGGVAPSQFVIRLTPSAS